MNVLIVDDEPQARERLSRLLGELEGYTVMEPSATNGDEALALIESLKPDVVLLDIGMPGLDGLQVAARLCEREAPPAVVFCTGDDEYGSQAFKESTLSHVDKPIQPQALRDALRRAEKPNRAQLAALTRPAGETGGPRSHISARTRKGIELIPCRRSSISSLITSTSPCATRPVKSCSMNRSRRWRTSLASASCVSTATPWSPASASSACSVRRWGISSSISKAWTVTR